MCACVHEPGGGGEGSQARVYKHVILRVIATMSIVEHMMISSEVESLKTELRNCQLQLLQATRQETKLLRVQQALREQVTKSFGICKDELLKMQGWIDHSDV